MNVATRILQHDSPIHSVDITLTVVDKVDAVSVDSTAALVPIIAPLVRHTGDLRVVCVNIPYEIVSTDSVAHDV